MRQRPIPAAHLRSSLRKTMAASPTAVPPHATPPRDVSIKVVSHSMLFYWWPVWAFGLILGFLTLFSGHRLALIPEGTTIKKLAEGRSTDTFELTAPARHDAFLRQAAARSGAEAFP